MVNRKFIKLFERFRSVATKDDIIDALSYLDDEYEVNIEVYETSTDPFFPFIPNTLFDITGKRPKIWRYEAISKIIEIKTGHLLTPKFIESYMTDYYGHTTASQELKDYHKQFSNSERYPEDIELIKDYEHSDTFVIFLNYSRSEVGLIHYNYDTVFNRLKSLYDLDKIYFYKNQWRNPTDQIDNIRVTMMVV